jgi:hypothetical protein
MEAIVQDRYGEADVLHLEDIDTPRAGSGEVLRTPRTSSSSRT